MLDRLLRRFVRITYAESPANPLDSTVAIHLTAHRWMPRRVVLAVASGWLSSPARLLVLQRSWMAGDVEAKWTLTFDRLPERNDHA